MSSTAVVDDEDIEENITSDLMKSVVKIFATHCGPWYSQPWEMDMSNSSTSSGFIMCTQEREILCNAHGVMYATNIRVRKFGESKKYNARVKYIGHDCDLAVLSIEDDQFWSGVTESKSIEFMEATPSLQDTITVLGYPKGGDDLSVTQGVVSRVGFTHYSHSLQYLLTIQIDAAINDGNSGGPCLGTHGKVVGVAFQGLTDADNIGYCIPVRVVQHFLECKRRQQPFVVPSLSFVYSNVENAFMKQYLRMIPSSSSSSAQADSNESAVVQQVAVEQQEMQGILVNKLFPFTDVAVKLREQDVVLAVDGIAIGDDGTIRYGKNSRINVNYIISNKFEGDSVTLKILRAGQLLEVSVTLKRHNPLCAAHLLDKPVEYYIFGGLIFLPLSGPFLQSKFGEVLWRKKAPPTLQYVYFNRVREFEHQQCIVLSQVLASDLTVGYHNYKNYILESVTLIKQLGGGGGEGEAIKIINLMHLAELMDEVVQKEEHAFIKFRFEKQHIIVLNVRQVASATKQILKRHKIEYDRSENLRQPEEVDDVDMK